MNKKVDEKLTLTNYNNEFLFKKGFKKSFKIKMKFRKTFEYIYENKI